MLTSRIVYKLGLLLLTDVAVFAVIFIVDQSVQLTYYSIWIWFRFSFKLSSTRDSFSSKGKIRYQSVIMVGISNEAGGSRMQQLTQGRRLGFRGLIGANRYLLFSSLFACIGSFMYGTDQGILSNLLTGQNFGSKFPSVYSDPVLKG